MFGTMSDPAPVVSQRKPWAWLLVGGLILIAALALVAGGSDVAGLARQAIERIRAVGAVPFFVAMAVVPAPLAWFTIPAGEAFAEQLTLGGVIAAALGAIAINIAFAYWIARYGLRPLIEQFLHARGHVVPRVTRENALLTTLLVRLTPGPPLFLQCYVLGVAEVPFGLYLVVSWLITVPWVIGGVVLGRGVLNGSLTLAMAGLVVLLAAMLGWRWIRRRLGTRAA